MQSHFGPDFFSANRDTLRQAFGGGAPIVIAGNGVMQRGSDEPSPFHQDSNFWYLTGLSGPDLTLVMTKNDTYVIVPSLSAVREAFDGAHDLATYAARSGITSYLNEREGWTRLRHTVRTEKQAATLFSPPHYIKQYGLYSLPFRSRLISRLRRMAPDIVLHDLRFHLATLRAVKQPEELLALQKAINITSDSLQEIIKGSEFSEAANEYEIEAALTYQFRKRGAEDHAFSPIVGAGTHGVTLHHIENNGSVHPEDLVVLDVGAAVEHYSADITRTVSKRPVTGRKAEVFRAVEAVQEHALSLIKAGMLYRDYEHAVEKRMGQELVKLGIISDPTHENIRRYYPHATSHFLGLDTHDVGNYHEPLQAGMVITCEPGIYIPEEGIGVRIEDDILITADGYKNLSGACPRRLTPVE